MNRFGYLGTIIRSCGGKTRELWLGSPLGEKTHRQVVVSQPCSLLVGTQENVRLLRARARHVTGRVLGHIPLAGMTFDEGSKSKWDKESLGRDAGKMAMRVASPGPPVGNCREVTVVYCKLSISSSGDKSPRTAITIALFLFKCLGIDF